MNERVINYGPKLLELKGVNCKENSVRSIYKGAKYGFFSNLKSWPEKRGFFFFGYARCSKPVFTNLELIHIAVSHTYARRGEVALEFLVRRIETETLGGANL